MTTAVVTAAAVTAVAVTACPAALMGELRAFSQRQGACRRYGVAVLDPARRRRILKHANPATDRMHYRPLAAGERVPLGRSWPTEYHFCMAFGSRIVPVVTPICLHYT
jgi:hypothetical protein